MQIQVVGTYKLTSPLRYALQCFSKVLRERWQRKIPYEIDALAKTVILYSDAESTGRIASVIICPTVRVCYYGTVPAKLRELLRSRETQIIAFELIAAIVAILQVQQLGLNEVSFRHFVDSTPALSCILKASSKQDGLNNLSGLIWFTAGKLLKDYWAQYVPSAANLADGPSRNQFSVVTQLGIRIVRANFSACTLAAESWIASMAVEALVV